MNILGIVVDKDPSQQTYHGRYEYIGNCRRQRCGSFRRRVNERPTPTTKPPPPAYLSARLPYPLPSPICFFYPLPLVGISHIIPSATSKDILMISYYLRLTKIKRSDKKLSTAQTLNS